MTSLITTAILSYGTAESLGSVVPGAHAGAPSAMGIAASVLYLVSYLVLSIGLARVLTSLRNRKAEATL